MDLEKLLHGGEMDGTLAALIHSRLRAISFLVGAVAVVADEVRKLAEESSQSSQEIGTLIGKAIDAIEEGTAVVREASETIAGITQHADHAAELVTRIGDESRDAREKMKEVRRLGSAILAVVTDNSAISEECAASSSQLPSYSDALKENVGRFRTQ